jgi:uncharacterized protein (TIGR02588 family)
MATSDPQAERAQRHIPLLEWVVAGLGALLVAGTIGYLVLQALGRDQSPPDIEVTTLREVALEHGHLVEFRAVNRGGETAAQLMVQGELAGAHGPVETAEATLDYLPPGSQREGGLLFSRDPREFKLRLRATSYVRP